MNAPWLARYHLTMVHPPCGCSFPTTTNGPGRVIWAELPVVHRLPADPAWLEGCGQDHLAVFFCRPNEDCILRVKPIAVPEYQGGTRDQVVQ